MKKKLALALLIAAAAAFLLGRWSAPPETAETGHAHPDEGEDTIWTCSMHPQIRSQEPGSCPICGMDLVPATSLGAEDAEGPGIVLSPRARTLARLETALVTRSPAAARTLRLLGRVKTAEDELEVITSWVGGRIERLRVTSEGARVRRGQVVAQLYAPEVYAAEKALQVSVQGGAPPATVRALERRLELLGVSEREIAAIRRAEAPRPTIPLRAQKSGVVLRSLVTEGDYVKAGSPLLEMADLSTVWVELDAYEEDLSLLEEGQTARILTEGVPPELRETKVDFVDPIIDPATRTGVVRLALDNPGLAIKPGLFVEAVIEAEVEGSELTVPASAPLFAGERALVYVEERSDADRPRYLPRAVRLGDRLGDRWEILAGLEEGERVVSEGAFVIDADLQIQGGESLMSLPGANAAPPPPVFRELTRAEEKAARALLEASLDLSGALAEDDLSRAQAGFRALAAASSDLPVRLRAAGERIARLAAPDPSTLRAARARLLQLDPELQDFLRVTGNPLEFPIHLAFCPMADGERGATWLQRPHEVRNAYFGEEMYGCGEIRLTLAPGERMPPREAAPAPGPSSKPYAQPASQPSSGARR